MKYYAWGPNNSPTRNKRWDVALEYPEADRIWRLYHHTLQDALEIMWSEAMREPGIDPPSEWSAEDIVNYITDNSPVKASAPSWTFLPDGIFINEYGDPESYSENVTVIEKSKLPQNLFPWMAEHPHSHTEWKRRIERAEWLDPSKEWYKEWDMPWYEEEDL